GVVVNDTLRDWSWLPLLAREIAPGWIVPVVVVLLACGKLTVNTVPVKIAVVLNETSRVPVCRSICTSARSGAFKSEMNLPVWGEKKPNSNGRVTRGLVKVSATLSLATGPPSWMSKNVPFCRVGTGAEV